MYHILVINPGSTSTKVAVYDDDKERFTTTIHHPLEELSKYRKIVDQYEMRKKVILDEIKNKGCDVRSLSAVVGRGGLLKPIPGGTYLVNEKMIEDLRKGVQGEHASNLGGILAYEIAHPLSIPAYIVDPVVVDEMTELARLSGIKEIKRRSIFHALNQKSVAREVAKEMGKSYGEVNFIVVHLGGGISVGLHEKGRVVDVNNALNGDGPYAPERSGGLPAWDLINLALSGKYTREELKKLLAGKGGIVSYLGTNDMREVEERVLKGDEYATLIFDGMAYQVSKEIGALSTVVKGKVDAIILTGGLARSKWFVERVIERVKFIAPVKIYPGENEMKALAMGALRVLRGEEEHKEYN